MKKQTVLMKKWGDTAQTYLYYDNNAMLSGEGRPQSAYPIGSK